AAGDRKVDVPRAHEQVIVFESDREVRDDAEFEAYPDGAPPAGLVGCVDQCRGGNIENVVLRAGEGTAAFHVDERIVEGITDLPGEQAESIQPRLVPIGVEEL